MHRNQTFFYSYNSLALSSNVIVIIGLIARTAAEILSLRQFLASEEATLTISWYHMKAQSPESIIDVLNAAASSGLAVGAGTPGLGLRDADDGQGVVVPGLWEVEVKSAQDAQNIILQVRNNAMCRRLAADAHHSMITLHVRGIWGSEAPVHTRGPLQNVHVVRNARLSFMCLGPILDGSTQNGSILNGTISPFSAPSWSCPSAKWVQLVTNLMTSMVAQHPTPQFKRCRLTTVLRDALRGSLYATWLCVLNPSLENAPLSLASLRFAQQIRSLRDIYSGFSNRETVKAVSATKRIDKAEETIEKSRQKNKVVPMRKPPQPPSIVEPMKNSPVVDAGTSLGSFIGNESNVDSKLASPGESPVSMLAAVDGDAARLMKKLEETCIQLQCERDALLPLTGKEKQRLRKAEREAKDHDM